MTAEAIGSEEFEHLYRDVGTARNLLLAEGRHRRRIGESVHEPGLIAESADGAGLETADTVVLAALNRLGPQEREILLLTEWERLTPTEAAVVLGIKPGTARVRLHRARRTLASDAELAELVDRRKRALRAEHDHCEVVQF